MDHFQIDDPVSAVPVHCFCGAWGLILVGLAGEKDELETVSYTHLTLPTIYSV